MYARFFGKLSPGRCSIGMVAGDGLTFGRTKYMSLNVSVQWGFDGRLVFGNACLIFPKCESVVGR